jgi:hypothetical protein
MVYTLSPTDWAVLESLRGGAKDVRRMIKESGFSRSGVYASVKKLRVFGLVQSVGDGVFELTLSGLELIEQRVAKPPEGAEKIYPPIEHLPTPLHKAIVVLEHAAVIARHHEIMPYHHLTFVLVGPTMTGKTSLARFMCAMYALDEDVNIINASSEAGASLGVRRGHAGEPIFIRKILEKCYVAFEDYQYARKETRRWIDLFMEGKRRVAFENRVLTIHPVSQINLNPRPGKSLEQMTGLNEAQIRRCVICLLRKNEMPKNIRFIGEDILKNAKDFGSIEIPKPKFDCSPYIKQIDSVLERCLKEESLNKYVDVVAITMLCTAMTAHFDVEHSIKLVLYNYCLIVETLGWTNPGWRNIVQNFNLAEGVGRKVLEMPRSEGTIREPKKEARVIAKPVKWSMPNFKPTDEDVEKLMYIAVKSKRPISDCISIFYEWFELCESEEVGLSDVKEFMEVRPYLKEMGITLQDIKENRRLEKYIKDRFGCSFEVFTSSFFYFINRVIQGQMTPSRFLEVTRYIQKLKEWGYNEEHIFDLFYLIDYYKKLGKDKDKVDKLALLNAKLEEFGLPIDDAMKLLEILAKEVHSEKDIKTLVEMIHQYQSCKKAIEDAKKERKREVQRYWRAYLKATDMARTLGQVTKRAEELQDEYDQLKQEIPKAKQELNNIRDQIAKDTVALDEISSTVAALKEKEVTLTVRVTRLQDDLRKRQDPIILAEALIDAINNTQINSKFYRLQLILDLINEAMHKKQQELRCAPSCKE